MQVLKESFFSVVNDYLPEWIDRPKIIPYPNSAASLQFGEYQNFLFIVVGLFYPEMISCILQPISLVVFLSNLKLITRLILLYEFFRIFYISVCVYSACMTHLFLPYSLKIEKYFCFAVISIKKKKNFFEWLELRFHSVWWDNRKHRTVQKWSSSSATSFQDRKIMLWNISWGACRFRHGSI